MKKNQKKKDQTKQNQKKGSIERLGRILKNGGF